MPGQLLDYQDFMDLPETTQKYVLYKAVIDLGERQESIMKVFWTIIAAFVTGSIGFGFVVLQLIGSGG